MLSGVAAAQTRLTEIATPALVLDHDRLDANVARMNERVRDTGVTLRPHLKTVKSVDVARATLSDPSGPATVATLMEAESYGRSGVTDLLYAVGITPSKVRRVLDLRASGLALSLIVDNLDAARAVAAQSRAAGDPIPTLIEIDTDGQRAGVKPGDAAAIRAIGEILHSGGAELRGVLTHAGASYDARTIGEIEAIADAERTGAIEAAETLRAAGLPAPVVSIGSTPTALFGRSLEGVTELRAGVYMFFDLVMAGIGVCRVADIALSVLTEVIGHQPDKGWTLVDAGWMALSRDRGTAKQPLDQGYGVVCDLEGRIYPDLIVVNTHQEQSAIAVRPGSSAVAPELPVGTRLRIHPNHACATGAQHEMYHVVRGNGTLIQNTWKRFRGW
jgi:D-serine deaminase-like pyridoxal phosphate-dependent protein